jgi:Mg-chelatase subunit ChlD
MLLAKREEVNKSIAQAQTYLDRLEQFSSPAAATIPDSLASEGMPQPTLTADELRHLNSIKLETEVELARSRSLLENLTNLSKEQLIQTLPATITDSVLSSLLEQKKVANQRLTLLDKDVGTNMPEMVKARASLADLQDKIDRRVDGIMQSLRVKVDAMAKGLMNLNQRVEEATLARQNQPNPPSALTNPPPEADLPLEKPAAPAPMPQPEVQTRENAFSTFSLNVSDVSFKLAAASLEQGALPEPASVRTEEFINAFDYRDPEAPPGVPVAFAFERARYPFAHNRDLLRFSLKTAAQGREQGRPLNVVLVLDTSGSMERADRVRIVREALRVLAAQLGPQDTLSVVTFARTPRLWVDGIPGSEAGRVAEQVAGITPEGGTNLEEALNLAYQTALRHYLAGGINRVVLLTDGAANLGNVEPEVLKQKVRTHRQQGIALDCFGIGWEGYNDDLLEVLTRNGDGRYGFLNRPEEAAAEFAGQLAGALRVAASDVKVQVEFNPARVRAYRQMGYAKHQLTKEQFRDNSVPAAQIGAAESGNALYVIEIDPRGDGPLGVVRVRYRLPGAGDYREQQWTVPYTGGAPALERAGPALRLAATAAAFAEWLASSPFAADVSPDRLLGCLRGVPEAYSPDARPAKLDWMIRQAQRIEGK